MNGHERIQEKGKEIFVEKKENTHEYPLYICKLMNSTDTTLQDSNTSKI